MFSALFFAQLSPEQVKVGFPHPHLLGQRVAVDDQAVVEFSLALI